MKLGLIYSQLPSERTTDDEIVHCGLERLLAGHELTRFYAGESHEEPHLSELRAQDFLIVSGEERWSNDSIRRFPWTREFFENLGREILPVGLSLPGGSAGLADWAASFLKFLAAQGKLSAADPGTRDLLAGALGHGAVTLTGSAALFAEFPRLRFREPRTVFCPPHFMTAPTEAQKDFVREVYETLSVVSPALFLAHTPEALELGARPGIETFFSPLFPRHHGTALVSADRVVSFRALPALAAVANGVHAVILGADEPTRKIAEALAIPCLNVEPGMSPQWLGRYAEEVLRDYPWEEVKERVARMRRHCFDWLEERGIKSRRGLTPPGFAGRGPRRAPLKLVEKRAEAKPPLHCASVSDINYLPFLLGFVENVLTFAEPEEAVFHVCALDAETGPELKARFPGLQIHIYTLEDLWEREELSAILSRGIGFRAFSSKPRLLARVLERVKQPVVYGDSDVFFFDSPRTILDALGHDAVLLFPHWNDVFSAARRDGLYNAGMMAVGPGAEPFLAWWSMMCLHDCAFDHSRGAVGDQGYLDFAPVYFEGVKSYQGGDHDVARWNARTLELRLLDRLPLVPLVGEGRPVKTYHAAFVDEMGVFESKYTWDALVTFYGASQRARQSRPLFDGTLVQQRRHWLSLSRLLALNDYLGARFSAWKKKLSPEVAAFFTGGSGRKVLPLLARANRFFGRLTDRVPRSEAPGAAEPDAFWVASQKQLLTRYQGVSKAAPAPTAGQKLSPTEHRRRARRRSDRLNSRK